MAKRNRGYSRLIMKKDARFRAGLRPAGNGLVVIGAGDDHTILENSLFAVLPGMRVNIQAPYANKIITIGGIDTNIISDAVPAKLNIFARIQVAKADLF